MDRAAAFVQALAARGGPRLASLEWHAELGSTSDRLKELARAGAPEWTAVMADRQTGGRGRGGRSWHSPPGGLYLSVLLRPQPERAALVPLAAGVAVAEAVAGFGVASELKWPNDVLVAGRKLAGILAEACSGPSGASWVALGIGVNVEPDVTQLPPALRATATSLHAEGAAAADPASLAAAALARLRVWYDALRVAPVGVVAAWRSRAVPWWGTSVEVRTGEGVASGRLLGVDDDGALVIEPPGGAPRRFVSGEVTQLRPAAGR